MPHYLSKLIASPAARTSAVYLATGIVWLLLPNDLLWPAFDLFLPVGAETAKWLTFIAVSCVTLHRFLHVQMDKASRSAGYARRMQQFARGLIENCPLPIVVKDNAGTIVLVNNPIVEDHGRPEAHIVGRKIQEFFPKEIAERLTANDRQAMETRSVVSEDIEFSIGNKPKYARVVKFPILDDNAEVRGTGTFSIDLTASRLFETELRQRRLSDDHTGLPNRDFVARELPRQVAQSTAEGVELNLLLVAFEGLGRVESTLGQSIADEALLASIGRIKNCVADGLTIAHLRGWDILILYSQIAGRRRPASVAKSILEAFGPPITMNGHSIFPTPRIGIAICPKDGTDPDMLLMKVRTALTDRTTEDRRTVNVSLPHQNRSAQRRLAIETQLRNALDRNEFVLNYQAQVAAADERIVGAEALLRWRNHELGFVSPLEFIPIAEESGLINDIERWVVETACKEAQTWSEFGGGHLRVGVNVTATQFRSQEFVRFISKILRETGLAARRLDLEITERVLLDEEAMVSENLNWLAKLNVHLSIDDFGTGYSSLKTLKSFPFNVVKIDKSFIDNIVDDAGDLAITKTIIGMAKTLGLSVIAEGVETEVQRDALRRLGCNFLQGYLYSRPISAFEFRQFIRRHTQLASSRVRVGEENVVRRPSAA